MPINPIVLQRRHAEIGRIRLGEKGSKGQPVKLDRFRFTSPSNAIIGAIADLYGGTPRPWDNSGRAEHEVTTNATSIPVIVVKGGLSQWLETWTGGGCVHRCDGVVNVLTDTRCDPEDRNHQDAKPTTRLSVMLRDVETMGVFRMESHGWNAAAEIPAMAELAMFVGDLVPAHLHLVERKIIRDGKTSRFVVPVLDLAVSKQRLVELVGGAPNATAIGAPATPAVAIEAGPDFFALLAEAQSVDECQSLWHAAGKVGALSQELKDAIKARAAALNAAPAPADQVEQAEEESVDDLWFRVMAAAGSAGVSEPALRAAFARSFGHDVGQATAQEMTLFLAEVKAMGAAA